MNIAVYGYGNLGKGIEANMAAFGDMNLVGIFTRRDPSSVKSQGTPVFSASSIQDFKDKIDVLVIAGGSATDLPLLTPALARDFNVIDSFDTHARIPEHFDAVDKAASESGHIAMISSGWDPGMFSLARVYADSILPNGRSYTFWGRGVSQGHSDAIRRIDGVLDARQYTVPREDVIASVRSGNAGELSAQDMHIRDCYVVAAPGADKKAIEKQIKNMPNYFAGYETHVTFMEMDDFRAQHCTMPHGGSVIRRGSTGRDGENGHTVEFRLDLDSNPQFTSSVILAYARALCRLHKEGRTGCTTVFDIAPRYLSSLSDEELRGHLL